MTVTLKKPGTDNTTQDTMTRAIPEKIGRNMMGIQQLIFFDK